MAVVLRTWSGGMTPTRRVWRPPFSSMRPQIPVTIDAEKQVERDAPLLLLFGFPLGEALLFSLHSFMILISDL